MYTGIVEECGRVGAVTDRGRGASITVGCDTEGLDPDDSISLSGVCVTAERVGEGWFEGHLSGETLARTYLGTLSDGDPVNIERPLGVTDRFDGHVVKGTVDTVTEVLDVEDHGDGEGWTFTVRTPEEYGAYVVEKGALALDGISLTVSDVSAGSFTVAVVPRTHERTTLSAKDAGDPVHFEADIFAKYAAGQDRAPADC